MASHPGPWEEQFLRCEAPAIAKRSRKGSSRARTKAEKQQCRQHQLEARVDPPRFQAQTLLEKVAVSLPVAIMYQKRIEELKFFAKSLKLNLKTKANFDAICCKFVNNMFELGFDVQDGSKTLAAIVDAYPDFAPKHMLPRTRRALQGWAKLEPQQTRPPIPWPLLALMVLTMLKRKQRATAGAVLLMFTGYLRPGEALDLQRQDLVRPIMPGSRHYALHLHPAQRQQQSKVGLSDESILLDSPLLPWLGDALMNIMTHPAYLLDLTYNKLVKEWKQTLIALGLSEKHAVLYQLRHAGPSYDRHQSLQTLPEVKQRGRWAADSSVRRYEAHARINQEFHLLPKNLQDRCLKAASSFPSEAPKYFGL